MLDLCGLLSLLSISFTLSNSVSGEEKDSYPFLKVRTGDDAPVPEQWLQTQLPYRLHEAHTEHKHTWTQTPLLSYVHLKKIQSNDFLWIWLQITAGVAGMQVNMQMSKRLLQLDKIAFGIFV